MYVLHKKGRTPIQILLVPNANANYFVVCSSIICLQYAQYLRGDAGHRKIKLHLVLKFLYYQMEGMPVSNFSRKKYWGHHPYCSTIAKYVI